MKNSKLNYYKMCDNIDSITIENELNISERVFSEIRKEVDDKNFFKFLSSFNTDIITNSETEDDITSIYIKNITDEADDEISMIRFTYFSSTNNDEFHLNALSDKNYDGDEFFVVDYESFNVFINKHKCTFVMNYNSKKYPKCIFIVIRKYFERIFGNLSKYLEQRSLL